MKQLLLCLFLILVHHTLFAANHAKGAYCISTNQKIKSYTDSTFRITGKVVDAQNGAPLQLATVTLIANDSSSNPLKMILTSESGEFQLEHDQVSFSLNVSFIGYQSVKPGFNKPANSILNVGLIKLIKSPHVLNEITVNANKPVLEMITGGYRFNANSNIIAAGSNMAEMLKQVPGLVVDDLQGKIELLGKSPSVLINGRKVNIAGHDLLTYLRSLPSNEILSINVLTSPGAQYDAAGEGGVLDIRLRKRSQFGFFGSVNAGISTQWRTDESANLNLKLNRIDISAGYNFAVGKNPYRRNDVIENYMLPDTSHLFLQNQFMNELQRSHSIRTNITYNIDSSSAVSVNYWYACFYGRTPNDRTANIFNKAGNLQRRLLQNDTNILDNDFNILDAVYDKDFGAGSKLQWV